MYIRRVRTYIEADRLTSHDDAVKLQTNPTTEIISKSSTTRRYSIILGNLGNTRDRFCGGYKEPLDSLTTLRQAAQIPQVEGIELVGSWDVARDNVADLKGILKDLDLKCVSIIPDLFTQRHYGKGSFSSSEARVRQLALDHTREMCEIAGELGCSMLNIWPGRMVTITCSVRITRRLAPGFAKR